MYQRAPEDPPRGYPNGWKIALLIVALAIAAFALGAATADAHRKHRCRGVESCYSHVYRYLTPDARGKLARVSACESDYPSQHDASGTYHGAFQYDYGTWHEAGFLQDPHTVSYRQQAVRTWRFAKRVGWGRWPICGSA